MEPDLRDSYRRQINTWRDELRAFGKKLDEAHGINGFEDLVTQVKDLRVRVRQVCRELNIFYDDGDPIAVLVRRIEKVIE